MFRQWLKTHRTDEFTYTGRLFPDVTDRAYWAARFDARCVEYGERFLGYAWPLIRATQFMEFTRSGDRGVMEKPHFARRHALISLVTAEVLENKGRFLGDIVDGVYLLCEESYWGVSAHWQAERGNIQSPEHPYIDLFAAETAEILALVYYLLYTPLNGFCPEILARIEYEMNRRIFVPYLDHRDYWWMGYGRRRTNNWNPWIISNVMLAFFLLERNPRRVEEAVGKMMTELQNYMDAMPNDGGCDEGPSYWGVAGMSLFECVYQLKVATGGGIDLMEDEKFRNILTYVEKVYIGKGKFVNFADGSVGGPGMCGDLLWLVGREVGLPRLMELGGELFVREENPAGRYGGKLRRKLLTLSAAREMAEMAPYHPADCMLLPDLQVAALRRGGFFLAAKGGHNNESHNHNDIANFILYDEGKPVLIDAGVGDYTRQTFSGERYTIWTMQSGYHNLPDVGGVQQRNGEVYCADRFVCEADSISIGFGGAYPAEAGLVRADRDLCLREEGLDVCDSFVFAGEVPSVTEHLMVSIPPVVVGDTVTLDGRYAITCSGAAISIDEIDFTGNVKLTSCWRQNSLWRINLTPDNGEQVKFTVRRI